MGDKKRKSYVLAGSEMPKKKSKKSATTDDAGSKVLASAAKLEPTPMPPAALPEVNKQVKSSKKSRKRAADFLDDDENETIVPVTETTTDKKTEEVTEEVKPKKSKKSKKTKDKVETLTLNGINGVAEHAGDEEVKVLPSSMQAEAQRTVDRELMDEFDPVNGDLRDEIEDEERDDLGAALLAGFDSDTSDHAKDVGLDVENLPGLPNYKKTKKQLRKVKEKGGSDRPGVVYVGRVPHGFYEIQMRSFFSQFGDITKLRLSRNRRTGASKHFAFIEFASEEVAKIVAETMDNYLMFGHILKCKFAPAESLHPGTWKGANKKFRKIPHEKLEQERLTAPKSAEQWRKKNEKVEKQREKKAKELKEKLGYDAPKVDLVDPAKALEANKLEEQEKPKEIEDAVQEKVLAMAAIEAAPQNAAPTTNTETTAHASAVTPKVKTEKLSKKKDKKEKKAKKEKMGTKNDDSKPAEPVAPVIKTPDTVPSEPEAPADAPIEIKKAAEAIQKVLDAKKDKKDKKAKKEKSQQELSLEAVKAKDGAVKSKMLNDKPAKDAEEDWEDDESSHAEEKPTTKVDTKAKSKAPVTKPSELAVFKKPKAPKDAQGRENFRTPGGKYVPPLQRKQLARAKFAKEHPEVQKADKKKQLSERKQKRADKKERRAEKLREKFGKKNVKGGENYKSSKKDKAEVGNE